MINKKINPIELIIDNYISPRKYGLKSFLSILSIIIIALQWLNFKPDFLIAVLVIAFILLSITNVSLYNQNFKNIPDYILDISVKKYDKVDILPALIFARRDLKTESVFLFPTVILLLAPIFHLLINNYVLLLANMFFLFTHLISVYSLSLFVNKSIYYLSNEQL